MLGQLNLDLAKLLEINTKLETDLHQAIRGQQKLREEVDLYKYEMMCSKSELDNKKRENDLLR